MSSIFSWLDALAVKMLIFERNVLKPSPNPCVYLQNAGGSAPSLCCKKRSSWGLSITPGSGVSKQELEQGAARKLTQSFGHEGLDVHLLAPPQTYCRPLRPTGPLCQCIRVPVPQTVWVRVNIRHTFPRRQVLREREAPVLPMRPLLSFFSSFFSFYI